MLSLGTPHGPLNQVRPAGLDGLHTTLQPCYAAAPQDTLRSVMEGHDWFLMTEYEESGRAWASQQRHLATPHRHVALP